MTRKHAALLLAAPLLAGLVLLGTCTRGVRFGPVSHGPIVGSIGPDSAWLWLRTKRAAAVAIEHAADPGFGAPVRTAAQRTDAARDFTAKFLLTGLAPGAARYYRVVLDDVPRPEVHELVTAPASPTASFGFSVITDFIGNQPLPLAAALESLDPALLVVLGDLDHRNPGNPAKTPAEARANMRAMHRELRGEESPLGRDVRRLLVGRAGRQFPFLHVWDDHDFGKNNSDRTYEYRAQALQAFDEYFVKGEREGADPARGIWQLQSYGCADLFLLDLRSERDPNDAPNGPAKTMLGAEQKAWLKERLAASTRKWKFLFSTVPFNPTCKPYDAWGSFQDEQQELVRFIRDGGITGVIVVSGDIHSGGAIDDGTHAFFPEISVPHGNCGRFVDTYKDQPGNWSHGITTGLGGAGFVHFDVQPAQVTATVRNEQGAVRMTFVLDG